MLLVTLSQRLHGHQTPTGQEWNYSHAEEKSGAIYLDEGLIVEGGGGHLQAHALLLVLLQSQRIDGEERHVGLQHKRTQKWVQDFDLTFNWNTKTLKEM